MDFFSKSLLNKIGAGVLLMLVFNIVTILLIFSLIQTQVSYGSAAAQASKLRVISQQIAKNVLLIDRGEVSARKDLETSLDLDEKEIDDLIEGSVEKGIQPASPQLKTQLEKVKDIWEHVNANVTIVLDSDTIAFEEDKDLFAYAVKYVINNNKALSDEANKAAEMYQAEFQSKKNTAMAFLILISVLNLIAFAVVILIVRRSINPVIELTKATKTIAKFSLGTKVKVTTKDEIGELAKSFNLMMDHLNKIMDEKNPEENS